MYQKKVDWAKLLNRHSLKSIWVTRLLFCQNDSPIGGSFWQKDSLITHILFGLCLLWYLAHSQILGISLYIKRWVGGVRKWQFLMIYSTVNHQGGRWVGLKKSKTWWRNTWMPPYQILTLYMGYLEIEVALLQKFCRNSFSNVIWPK